MRRFFSSLWTWAILLLALEIAGLFIVPSVFGRGVLTLLMAGVAIIIFSKRKSSTAFALNVIIPLSIVAILFIYINIEQGGRPIIDFINDLLNNR